VIRARDGTLWLVRHGHTVVHDSGGIAGRTDVALSDGGRQAVRALGDTCSDTLSARARAARWYVSPLGRTRESASILLAALGRPPRSTAGVERIGSGLRSSGASDARDGASDGASDGARDGARDGASDGARHGARHGARDGVCDGADDEASDRLSDAGSFVIDSRLVELDFGDWEGSNWQSVHRDDAAALALWGKRWVTAAPPNGESFAQQATRCGAWYDEHVGPVFAKPDDACDRALDGVSPADTVVVAHGGSIRALACRLLGWPLEEAMRFAIDPAAVFRFDRDADVETGWRLAGANLDDFG